MKKSNQNFPCYYHPTQVLFVDDSPGFLAAMELSYGHKLDTVQERNPLNALDLINSQSSACSALSYLASKDQAVLIDDDSDQIEDAAKFQLQLNLRELPSFLQQQNMNRPVAVVVVDYDMPEMNGLDFVRAIKNNRIKKIMLTAKADQDIAIEAFNDGLIDQFIYKTDRRLQEKLFSVIQELTNVYFDDLSENIRNIVKLDNSTCNLLQDKKYINQLNMVKEQLGTFCYHLYDQHGSYQFLDAKGQKTIVLVENKEGFLEKLALLESIEAPGELIDAVKSRKKLLFIERESCYHRPAEEWDKYLHDAIAISEEHYCAIIPCQP
ncbi:response regulator [Piscirickettsia litoralis]|uniref:Response regulatory domain-containing protein n=1 Tax=Piscirickettsia litoralis TaxID=1891921 RepID=A0ABX3A2K2_9GAMM|nr:response regulator [Piscirickettsia litoralis]ODN42864.1 hypothetical protein BGC07_07930 [Piscirickettsia litoralis]